MGPIDLFLDEPQAIDGGGALDYITTLVFALPGGDLPYWTHPVTATVHDFHASVRNFLVTVPEKDPFQPLLENFNVGVNAFGVSVVPLKHFSDHRGCYPCWFTEIVVQRRISYWKDEPSVPESSSTVLGSPPDKDKVLALEMWNAAAKSTGLIGAIRQIDYEDVTLMGQVGFGSTLSGHTTLLMILCMWFIQKIQFPGRLLSLIEKLLLGLMFMANGTSSLKLERGYTARFLNRRIW